MARTRSESARTKLLAATAELLVTDGVGAVTAEEVARRSGVAKTTLDRGPILMFPPSTELSATN